MPLDFIDPKKEFQKKRNAILNMSSTRVRRGLFNKKEGG
jgi:hypothetical protein